MGIMVAAASLATGTDSRLWWARTGRKSRSSGDVEGY